MSKRKGKGMMIPPPQHFQGEQLAGWTPKEQSSETYEVVCQANIAVRLADGTILRGDLYRPAAQGPFPTLVAWSSYTRAFQ